MKHFACLALLAVAAFGLPATVRYRVEAPIYFDSTDRLFSVPKFNPALGTLTSVNIRVFGRVSGTQFRENLNVGVGPYRGYSRLTCAVKIKLGSDGLLYSAQTGAPNFITFGSFDGTADFIGSSGWAWNVYGTSTANVTLTSSSVLSNFSGAGAADLNVLGSYFFDWTWFGASAPIVPASQLGANGTQSIVVSYNYIPV
jgi:hypothetical protein